ncbi:MAG: hypothetical protein ACI9ZT_001802 [Gammaproteobacteria bacterium]|jgi:hypothetical protein
MKFYICAVQQVKGNQFFTQYQKSCDCQKYFGFSQGLRYSPLRLTEQTVN